MPDLEIIDVNPLDRAGEIKDLFLADNAAGFPDFFDRAYPSAVQHGGKSWVGLDAQGKVVTHIARFSRRFTLGERTIVGGVLLNLIAAKSHRTLLPALALTRRMTADSRAQRDVDFLYANPNAAAGTLLKAAGFSHVGSLGRFVLPLAGRRWYTDVPVRLYQTMVRIRFGNGSARAVEHSASRFDAAAFDRSMGQTSVLRPIHPPELFRESLVGYPSGTDHWVTFHESASSTHATAAVLVRGGPDRIATLFSLSRQSSMPMSAIVAALAAALRRAGYSKLSLVTMEGTKFARELTRAGFVPRQDTSPLLACAVTDAGEEAVRCGAWEITALDCDPYLS